MLGLVAGTGDIAVNMMALLLHWQVDSLPLDHQRSLGGGILELQQGIQASSCVGPGSPVFHSSCEGELGIALESLHTNSQSLLKLVPIESVMPSNPDPSSKATLWVKAQHEGALPLPGIVRKDPRVPHTARRGA